MIEQLYLLLFCLYPLAILAMALIFVKVCSDRDRRRHGTGRVPSLPTASEKTDYPEPKKKPFRKSTDMLDNGK